MHIIPQEKYPIFDQHVFRAYCYMTKGKCSELQQYGPKKLKIYQDEYVPFFNEITKAANEHSTKDVDNALWMLGKIIKDSPLFGTAE